MGSTKTWALAAAVALLSASPSFAQTLMQCTNGQPTSTGCFNYGAVLVDQNGNPVTIGGGTGGGGTSGGAVYGPNATGIAPTQPPIFTSGIDPSGFVRPFATDAAGNEGVNVKNTVPVTGTFFQSVQPVSGTVTANQGGAPWAVSWSGQTVAATQSGTWSAGQGAPAAVANAWPTYLTQGGAALSSTNGLPTTDTNVGQTVTAAGTAPAKAQGVQSATGTALASAAGQSSTQSAAGTAPSTPTGIQGSGPSALPVGANITQFGGANLSTGTGAAAAGVPRVTVSNDSTVGLVAGSAVVGKVGIDQTTPGTTNKVSIGTDGTVTNNPSTGATLTTSQPSVTTTAAALTFSGTVHREIYNPAASTASIFIGATGVTTATGWEIPPGTAYDVSRFFGSVFAVAASAQTVRLISY